jgi:tRNA pseudouridine38-40 synthase
MTIQQALEEAIAAVVKATVTVNGASRTDAGVHARDQLAAVTLHHPIRTHGLAKGVNRRLPSGIGISDVRPVPLDFNPRFSNAGKIYCYRIRLGKTPRPLTDRFAWQTHWSIDWDKICEAAAHLVGTHDFASFAAAGGSHKTSVRTIYRFELGQEPHGVVTLRFTGNAFLKHMIRNIVGTLVDVGRGILPVDEIPRIIAAERRSAAGRNAPPQGLELEQMLGKSIQSYYA